MIAQLKSCKLKSGFDTSSQASDRTYLVPDETLLVEEAAALNIASEDDFFGGVVPCPVARTKAITHQLISGCTARSDDWSSAFADRVRPVVLPGYTVFTAQDARTATSRLLKFGATRLKMPLACRGTDQVAIDSIRELDKFLEKIPAKEVAEAGLVIEQNLRPVATLSIGQVTIDNLTITYHGVQRTVMNNRWSVRVWRFSLDLCARRLGCSESAVAGWCATSRSRPGTIVR